MTRANFVVLAGEREEEVSVEKLVGSEFRVSIGDKSYTVEVLERPGVMSLLCEGRQLEVGVVERGDDYAVTALGATTPVRVLDPLEHLVASSGAGAGLAGGRVVEALMPGRVVAILAAEGEDVEAGQGVVVLEAMKMENEIVSEVAGSVKAIRVEVGQAVEGGDVLFEVEPPS